MGVECGISGSGFSGGTTTSLAQGVAVDSGINSGLFHQLSLALLKISRVFGSKGFSVSNSSEGCSCP